MVEYGLGRLQALDDRDWNHRMAAALVARPAIEPVPWTRPWRYWAPGPTLDQGAEPQCVGYAWRQWLASTPVRTRTGPTAADIYTAAQLVDEWPGEGYAGTSVRAGAKVMQAQGRIAEYVWAETWQQVRDWLLARGPVVFGTNWYTGFFTPDQNGYVDATGSVEGGHAYLCIGFAPHDRADPKGHGSFRFINSWGSGWGQRGRFWIDSEMVGMLLASGEACAAVEVEV